MYGSIERMLPKARNRRGGRRRRTTKFHRFPFYSFVCMCVCVFLFMRLSIKCSRLISFVLSIFILVVCLVYVFFTAISLPLPPIYPPQSTQLECLFKLFPLLTFVVRSVCYSLYCNTLPDFIWWCWRRDLCWLFVCVCLGLCWCDCNAKSTVLWKLISIVLYTLSVSLHRTHRIKWQQRSQWRDFAAAAL